MLNDDHREPCASRRFVATLFVLIALFTTFTLYLNEHDSCARQDGVREASRIIAGAAVEARLASAERESVSDPQAAAEDRRAAAKYQRALDRSRPLDCSFPFPDT